MSKWARKKTGREPEAGFESAEFGSRYREIEAADIWRMSNVMIN